MPQPEFSALTAEQLPAAIELLQNAGLPTDDVDHRLIEGFIGRFDEQGALSAVGGLEPYGQYALLRSVVVAPHARGTGLARTLVAVLEDQGRTSGIQSLYLLTESAEGFFLKQGYQPCPREEAPEPIRRSPQFSTLCPDSAAFLCKALQEL